jgi:hypothetical protein
MKRTILLIALSILTLSVSCKKTQDSPGGTAIDATKIQSIALSSITATYTNLHSTDLAFAGMTNLPGTGGAAIFEVRYLLPASAETNQETSQNRDRTIVKVRAFRVLLSPSGQVQSISEGKIATVRTVAK